MDQKMAKRVWHMIRVVYYMLRKGLSKRKIMMDLNLLFKRSKIAGKAISNLMTFHHFHHNNNNPTNFSCRFMDPKGVEFSCSNTPNYTYSFLSNKRKNKNATVYDPAVMIKAFEILNSSSEVSDDGEGSSVFASPSPAPLWWNSAMSTPSVRQLRITDSPFPVREEGDGGRVDQEAEEFIKRFYEQLRMQQTIPVTPECRQLQKRRS